ncbi:arrestin domain-containing protein 2-like [Culicoides brevitarsis]|uniref:arrestin domain-containing protein 2-like n=1 Tax=Culicoides brevitarsis TaxID=469753 RepID=UPI00307BF321
MTITCNIKFENNPQGIYFAGQNLAGSVELNLGVAKKVKAISLKICGFAYTHWSESETYRVNGKNHTRIVHYRGREDYLNSTTYLIGSPHANEIEILPGLHTYNFACLLPSNMPSSFEGPYGHIRYTVKVTLERPWKFDQTYKVGFTVLKQLDLNYDNPDLRLPVHAETIKYFCCWPCKSGPLLLNVKLPIGGYVPGQTIPITLTIDNESREKIDEITFKLKKIVRCLSQTPRQKVKEERVVVVMKRGGGCDKFQKKQYQYSLLIPALPPTNLSFCKIIQISYVLKVKPIVAGMHKDNKLTIPIVIGTVPLTADRNGSVGWVNLAAELSDGPNSMQERPTAPIEEHPDVVCVPSYDDAVKRTSLQPPSYEESMYGSVNIDEPEESHPLGNPNTYTPRYPVYHFGTVQPSAPTSNETKISTEL